jgi:hypothetical protein
MPALDREPMIRSNWFYSHSGQGRNLFVDGLRELPGYRGTVQGAGYFAGAAGRAAFGVYEDQFHKKSASNALSALKCLKF